MALNDWEFAYNGLTFGGNDDIALINVEGLSPPDARVDEIERQGDHGSFIYAQWLSSRIITIDGDVSGTSPADFDAKINQIRAAFTPQSSPLPLQLDIPGGALKRINCVPARVSFPVGLDYSMLYDTWTVELRAEDPRLYSDTLYNSDLTPLTANGIGFNLAFSVNFGGTTGGGLSQTITNQGTFPTLPVITIHGPCVNPVIRNLTLSTQISLALNLAATEFVVIDFQARTIMLGGTSSRYSALQVGSRWWPIMPGANTIQFSATGTTGNTKATVTYRDAWN